MGVFGFYEVAHDASAPLPPFPGMSQPQGSRYRESYFSRLLRTLRGFARSWAASLLRFADISTIRVPSDQQKSKPRYVAQTKAACLRYALAVAGALLIAAFRQRLHSATL